MALATFAAPSSSSSSSSRGGARADARTFPSTAVVRAVIAIARGVVGPVLAATGEGALTTGCAPSDLGAVNLTSLNSSAVLVCSPMPFSPSPANSNATVLGLVASLPYDVSVFAVDALLVPYGFDLAASKIRPRSASTSCGCSSRRAGSTSPCPCSSAGGARGA
uniref:Uncharacterized protein n=1 Tax=Ananas comosus var. bracteatus TaxID=296719 RepID=A0A6V7PNQ2_ANACO|nr:unnamed protein product [Ananas comosus var. bracteatus]